jgi:long-chain acyl-CoA synthetase
MIISSGYCVYPNNIENVIDSHPDVSMSCVIGIPRPYKVMVAKAFIVLKDPNKENDETLSSIKELVEKNLARFSWPYEYEFRDELPKTRIGKVAFNVLIHEEEMKNKERKWDQAEELLEQVEDETGSDELIDNMKEQDR